MNLCSHPADKPCPLDLPCVVCGAFPTVNCTPRVRAHLRECGGDRRGERDLLNAPKTYALLRALDAAHVDVRPGSGLHIALMEFAHVEATKASELVKEYQRTNPITLRVVTSEEARRLIDVVQSEERLLIKALADALLGVPDYGRADDGLPCWCACSAGPHLERCESARAALRLAGRLP